MKEYIQGPRREKIWFLADRGDDPVREAQVAGLCQTLGITPVTARLLCNRGYTDSRQAELFLGADENTWHDPYLLRDMEAAVRRTLEAVRAGETIAIYGDYDVDGVTSVTALYLYLTGLGARVINYIPSRIKEGYGMSQAGIDYLAARGVSLIITVDTGITACSEVAYAAARGMETVVTDHHECHGDIPVCAAVVNPHRPDCTYPFCDLAGVGVVFKLICACEAARVGLGTGEALQQMGRRFMDLVAIGTIADVMPLRDENRFIVARGLAALNETDRPGLCALLDAVSGSGNTRPVSGTASGRPRRKVNTGLVSFGIAPRINAAGRMDHAMKAVDLLLAPTAGEAERMARELCEINTRRQAEENRIAEEAYQRIDAQLRVQAAQTPEGEQAVAWNRQVLVLEDDGWMQGIVGIVASRITEKYGLPSILISFDGASRSLTGDNDVGKGSGRSVKGLNLVEALAYCEDTLVRFGGHELAAGLTIRRGDIPAFRQKINAYAAAHLTDDMTAVRYEAECLVTMADLTMAQAAELERLEPYGVANQTPLFVMEDVTLQRIIPLSGGRHTKLTLYKDGQMVQAVWFGMTPYHLPAVVNDRVDVLFNLNINEYQGVRTLQLILQDMRVSETQCRMRRMEQERLAQVCAGASFRPEEQLLPDREDIARVYTSLRNRARRGEHACTEQQLTEDVNRCAGATVGYVKLRLILRILEEMQVLHISESGEGIFAFDLPEDPPRTSVDASPLLRRLRTQCRDA